ncbi:Os03g0183950 [Oryza sativa Japonica Group]|uniref:Os03g0183950 protein n=1 Tax=Oryza sativa subsp. japonica TaxID=39947 RepID=A0A0P0VTV0_ORYSJ|nr:hypothetical protein EE612_015713 [Oryza sativa]BAS82655.1 Os03g0183950 [Oryza sativa Japonica Group]
MAMIRTINGGKSYSQIDARRTNPICIRVQELAHRVVLHPLEDGAAGEDGADDDAEAGLGEHDVGGAPRGVRRVGDGDADVGLLQRRRVVHAVAGHPAHVAAPPLNHPHDLVLVLREHAGEPVRLLHELLHRNSRAAAVAVAAEQRRRRVHVGAHPKTAAGLLRDGQVIAGDHLHADAKIKRSADGVGAVVPRRVEQRQEAAEHPWSAMAVLRFLWHLLHSSHQIR